MSFRRGPGRAWAPVGCATDGRISRRPSGCNIVVFDRKPEIVSVCTISWQLALVAVWERKVGQGNDTLMWWLSLLQDIGHRLALFWYQDD